MFVEQTSQEDLVRADLILDELIRVEHINQLAIPCICFFFQLVVPIVDDLDHVFVVPGRVERR